MIRKSSSAHPSQAEFRLPKTSPGMAGKCGEKRLPKRTGSGSAEKVPVAGLELPTLEGIQWETKSNRPGLYAWYAPQGNKAPRHTKTYLGYVGKTLLAEWRGMAEAERRAAVAKWIAGKREGKGIG